MTSRSWLRLLTSSVTSNSCPRLQRARRTSIPTGFVNHCCGQPPAPRRDCTGGPKRWSTSRPKQRHCVAAAPAGRGSRRRTPGLQRIGRDGPHPGGYGAARSLRNRIPAGRRTAAYPARHRRPARAHLAARAILPARRSSSLKHSQDSTSLEILPRSREPTLTSASG